MKLTRSENMWIVLIWAIIFMVILVWDQEKIVLLNLILFCYFLAFLAKESIVETLASRRHTLLSALTDSLNVKVDLLTKLMHDISVASTTYNLIILILFRKFGVYINSIKPNYSALKSSSTFSFTAIKHALELVQQQQDLYRHSKAILVSNQIISSEITQL